MVGVWLMADWSSRVRGTLNVGVGIVKMPPQINPALQGTPKRGR